MKLLIISICLLCSTIFYADNNADNIDVKLFFSEDEITQVLNGDIIPAMFVKYNSKGENSHEKISIPTSQYMPEDFDQYEVLAHEKAFIPYKADVAGKLRLLNIMNSYSKLSGMEYYSRRAGKKEKLILESYRTISVNGKKLDDINYTDLQNKTKSIFMQRDNKFGKMFYTSEVTIENDNFIMVNTSIVPISKAIISLNNPGDFKTYTILIYDENHQGYFYYSVLAMRVRVDIILKQQIFGPTTFSNRLRASTVKLASMMGHNLDDRLNAWPGKYDKY